jgi:hypothetical protein
MRPDTNDLSECYYSTYRAILSIIHNLSPALPRSGVRCRQTVPKLNPYFFFFWKKLHMTNTIFVLHYSGGPTEVNYLDLNIKKTNCKTVKLCRCVAFFGDGWIQVNKSLATKMVKLCNKTLWYPYLHPSCCLSTYVATFSVLHPC